MLGLSKCFYFLLFKDFCCGRKYEKKSSKLVFSLHVRERDYIQKIKWKRLFGIWAVLFFSLRQRQTKISPDEYTHLLFFQIFSPFDWLAKNLRKPVQRHIQSLWKPYPNITVHSEEIQDLTLLFSSSVHFTSIACLMAFVCDHLNSLGQTFLGCPQVYKELMQIASYIINSRVGKSYFK